MGTCKYCGQKAGFLKRKHTNCQKKNQDGKKEIINLIERSITKSHDFQALRDDITHLANENFIKSFELDTLYTDGFDKAVEKLLNDGILTKKDEENIVNFRDQLNLTQNILDQNGSLQKIAKASIIREITEGNVPEVRLDVQGHIPFNFMKSEQLIWLFQDVDFYEQRTNTHFQGGHAGVSMRVAKGLYFRTGGFKGQPVKTEETKYIDTGSLCLTNKHLYFASSLKNFRIQYGKIITLNPYLDGIGLQKDGVSSRPLIFKNLDGWFSYNVISNLTQ